MEFVDVEINDILKFAEDTESFERFFDTLPENWYKKHPKILMAMAYLQGLRDQDRFEAMVERASSYD